MANLTLQHGAWQLARLSTKLGLIGGLGLVMLLGSFMFYLSTLLPLKQKVNEVKHTLASAALAQTASSNVKPPLVSNAPDDITAIKQLLPQAASLHKSLALIDQAATKQNLALNRGDYKFSKAKQSQISNEFYLSKYEIILPVAGQYAQIRQFIAQVLQLQPALALSDIKMTRDNSLSPNIEARLVFVLYLQSEVM